MRQRGFTLLESIIAIAIFVAVSINVVAILGNNTRRIYSSRLDDEMLQIAEFLVMEELDKGYTDEEEETKWENLRDEEGEVIHPDYIWRMVREIYESPEGMEGSQNDRPLRKKMGWIEDYMSVSVEVKRASQIDDEKAQGLTVTRIIPPPEPITTLRSGPVGSPSGTEPSPEEGVSDSGSEEGGSENGEAAAQ